MITKLPDGSAFFVGEVDTSKTPPPMPVVQDYRKKPVVIQAIELQWCSWSNVCSFIGEEWKKGFSGCYLTEENNPAPEGTVTEKIGLAIPTLEGVMIGAQGDFIIKGVKGEFYPCRADIFKMTYEPAQ